jgi:hypothetical protein
MPEQLESRRLLAVYDAFAVSALGSTATSSRILEDGVSYSVNISGFVLVQNSEKRASDAEYFETWDAVNKRKTGQWADVSSTSGLDVGVRLSQVTGAGKWGPRNPAGVYSQSVVGTGSPLQARFIDSPYTDNSGSFSVTISQNIPVSVAAVDATAKEEKQDPGTFRISRGGSTRYALPVSFSLAGTSSDGTADYTISHTGSVTIPAGQSFIDVTLTPVDDKNVELGEAVTLTLQAASQYDLVPGSTAAVVRIEDNDLVVDLDTDSNNDGVIDPDNSPAGTDDPIEEDAPGRYVAVREHYLDPLAEVTIRPPAIVPNPAAGAIATLVAEGNIIVYADAAGTELLFPNGGASRTWNTVSDDLPATVYVAGFTPGAASLTLTVTVGSTMAYDRVSFTVLAVNIDTDSDNDGFVTHVVDSPIEEEDPGALIGLRDEGADLIETVITPLGVMPTRANELAVTLAASSHLSVYADAAGRVLLVGAGGKKSWDPYNETPPTVVYVAGNELGEGSLTWTVSAGDSDSPGEHDWAAITTNSPGSGTPPRPIRLGKDRTMYRVGAVDLDVDSDDDDRLDPPERDDYEDRIELNRPKPIVVNSNDTDHDGVPDYADGFGLGGLDTTQAGIDSKRFTPLVIQIPADVPLHSMRLSVIYAASDPKLMGVDFARPEVGSMRIWTKNANEIRSLKPVTAGGDFLADGEVADLTKLGFSDSKREVTLYVEGVRTTDGRSEQISIALIVGDRLVAIDPVTVIVVSNTLVIGIDGTDTRPWLNSENGQRSNGLWNSHVRNLVADAAQHAMARYYYGPDWGSTGADSDEILAEVVTDAENLITDAGGDTIIALVGWSRGGMIALWAANRLVGMPGRQPPALPRQVSFVGLYDPVDMSPSIPSNPIPGLEDAAEIQPGVKSVTIVGPSETPNNNVDYPVGWPSYWLGFILEPDPIFVRMSQNGRIQALGGETTVERIDYNASHGAIGGCPGYSAHLVSIPDGGYDYQVDVERSILSDRTIRKGMRAAGLDFVPSREDEWYGFPVTRPAVR